jgi:hypothetical protein
LACVLAAFLFSAPASASRQQARRVSTYDDIDTIDQFLIEEEQAEANFQVEPENDLDDDESEESSFKFEPSCTGIGCSGPDRSKPAGTRVIRKPAKKPAPTRRRGGKFLYVNNEEEKEDFGFLAGQDDRDADDQDEEAQESLFKVQSRGNRVIKPSRTILNPKPTRRTQRIQGRKFL